MVTYRDVIVTQFFNLNNFNNAVYRYVYKTAKKWPLSSSCLSVHPSVCPYGTIQLILDRFSWNLIFEDFLKICWKNSSLIKVWQEQQVPYVKTCTFMIICCQILLRVRNISDISCREKQNTQFMSNNCFFPKTVPFMRWCGKYGAAKEAAYDNKIWCMHFTHCITKATHTQ
jgi:hypothetical protein